MPPFLYNTPAEELKIDRFEGFFLGLGQCHCLDELVAGFRVMQVHPVHRLQYLLSYSPKTGQVLKVDFEPAIDQR